MDIYLQTKALCYEYKHVTTLNSKEYISTGKVFVRSRNQKALAQPSINKNELLIDQDQNKTPLIQMPPLELIILALSTRKSSMKTSRYRAIEAKYGCYLVYS